MMTKRAQRVGKRVMRVSWLAGLLILFCFGHLIVFGAEESDNTEESFIGGIIDEQLRQLDIDQLQGMMPGSDANKLMPDISVGQIIQNVREGKPMIDIGQVTNAIIGYFTSEVRANLQFGAEILAICIIVGLLKNMSGAFGESAVSQVAMLICGCAAMGICLRSFIDIYRVCNETIQGITDIMQSLLPIMVTLMISSGNLSSGAIMNPVILAAINLFVTILTTIVLPGLFMASVFFLINGLTQKDYIKRLGKFIRTASLFIMGFCITIFSGVVALQGVVTSSADSLLYKGVKFSTDKFIPIIGGFVSDSLGLIMSCAGLIKSAVGVFGVILIVAWMMVPICKIIVISLIYKITSIVIEPLGEQKISDSINEIGNTVMTLAMILALATFLFLIFITILLNIGRI